MSDDLVKRLRELAQAKHDDLSIGDEAAAEITHLRARVAELEGALRQLESDCDADYPPSTGAIKYAIRAALTGGKDEA